MKRIQFVMLGGFLGAGKTTTMSKLAAHYKSKGLNVALVTNDQAVNLVDTNSLRSQGLTVEEVAGACFCCKFDELVDRIVSLEEKDRPDVIIAEPVGSCTDLVATVVQPLKDLYGNRFDVSPYPVIFKPSHGLKILKNEGGSGFSPKAAYIFIKQLEEADAIVINRIDEINASQLNELMLIVSQKFPGVPILKMSAKNGTGIDELSILLDQKGLFGRKILDIDYDIYAEGEAELGWLNSSLQVQSDGLLDVDAILVDVISRLRKELIFHKAEVAHLKAIGLADGAFGVANLVSNGTMPELSLPSNSMINQFDLIINARVAIDPVILEKLVSDMVCKTCDSIKAKAVLGKTQSFKPGRPVPTHRYSAVNAK
ncbi:MAG: cobalamin biosynthesis protein P47K [Planctomycetes bacterium]|nr:cobalamin biosynthesis protein P47K [Planctomycetota bacterium]